MFILLYTIHSVTVILIRRGKNRVRTSAQHSFSRPTLLTETGGTTYITEKGTTNAGQAIILGPPDEPGKSNVGGGSALGSSNALCVTHKLIAQLLPLLHHPLDEYLYS